MTYQLDIAKRVEALILDWDTQSRKMFGGICYMYRGNMMCGVYKNYLIVRLDPSQAATALKDPHVRPFDITGRPMKGWIMVAEEGLTETALVKWLQLARAHAASLPAK